MCIRKLGAALGAAAAVFVASFRADADLEASIARVELLYLANCMMCHGATGFSSRLGRLPGRIIEIAVAKRGEAVAQ